MVINMKNLIRSIVAVLLISMLMGIAPVTKTEVQAATIAGFSDVKNPKEFWFKPVYWASEKGITTGYKDGKFKPGNECTRAQMVTFLWRMKGSPAPKTKSTSFKDVKKTAYYYKPVLWAVEKGITTGYSKTSFKPNNVCTRAQTVTFLWRMAGKPKPKTSKSKFSDVKKNAYYYKAVLWASEKGIVAGYKDGTFKPNEKCLRRQIVTFLWKYSGKPEPKNLPDTIRDITITSSYDKTRTFDEFGQIRCAVPKVSIRGVDTSKVNSDIYSFAKKAVDSFDKAANSTWNIDYTGYEYYYTQDYVSIRLWYISADVNTAEGHLVKTFIIDPYTGKELNRSGALKLLGTSSAKFNKAVESKIKYVNEQEEKSFGYSFSSSMKSYNIAQAKNALPYVDYNGNLCYVVRIQLPAGSGYFLILGRLDGSDYDVWQTGGSIN